MIYEPEPFDHPGTFLQALHPLNYRWDPDPSEWVFRGHWDAGWDLVPSIYRAECVDPFLSGDWTFDRQKAASPEAVARMERFVLARAFEEFDRAGLAIPDQMNVGPLLLEDKHSKVLEDVPGMLIPFMALAQHHGVPTRLLDWTTQAKVAAYFAAAELVKNPDKTSGTMEVVAIYRPALQAVDDGGQRICHLWNAPRASNANLHAQSGVFTACSGVAVDTPLDKLLFEGRRPAPLQPIRRLRLPQSHANKLLQFLNYEGVSGGSIFPGYGGAVARLREDRLYWKKPTDPQ